VDTFGTGSAVVVREVGSIPEGVFTVDTVDTATAIGQHGSAGTFAATGTVQAVWAGHDEVPEGTFAILAADRTSWGTWTTAAPERGGTQTYGPLIYEEQVGLRTQRHVTRWIRRQNVD
jgi:hypothetical protein